MNINPYNQTTPHYDSYEDFYKFFEVSPREIREGFVPIEVFPPVEPGQAEEQKEVTRKEGLVGVYPLSGK